MTSIASAPPKHAETEEQSRFRDSSRGFLFLLSAVVVLGFLPFIVDVQALTLMNRFLVFGLMAASLNLLVGTAGLPSLGHATFAGIGGYAAALVAIHWTSGTLLQVVVAIVAATLVAALIGWVAVRSSGVYFLLLTLTIGELAFYLVESLSAITGGANGLAGVPAGSLPLGLPSLDGPVFVYWYVLSAVFVGYLVLRALDGSPFGLVLRGIRDNERRMIALGYRTGLYKYAAFCATGAVAGFAGAVNVTQQRFVSPDDIGYHLSALLILAVIIGGRRSLLGGFAGAAVIVLVQNELSAYLAGYGELLLGLAFAVIIVLMPSGLHGALKAAGAAAGGRIHSLVGRRAVAGKDL